MAIFKAVHTFIKVCTIFCSHKWAENTWEKNVICIKANIVFRPETPFLSIKIKTHYLVQSDGPCIKERMYISIKFAPGHIESAANTIQVGATMWNYCVYMLVAAICHFYADLRFVSSYFTIILSWHRFTASTWNTPGLYRGEERGISFTRLPRKDCDNSTCYHINKLEKELAWNIAIYTREKRRGKVHCSDLQASTKTRINQWFPRKNKQGA